MELQISESNDQVQLATRQHLFSIVAFLEGKLPEDCAVYNHVLLHLWTSNPVYKVYFQRNSNGEYRAVVALKKDTRLNDQNEIQTVWNVSAWAEDDETKVRLYKSIEDFNWETDEFIVTGMNYEAHPAIIALFEDHGRVVAAYSMDLFSISRQAALNTELRTPDDVYVKSLETRHAATVYDFWNFRFVTTVEAFVDSVIEAPSAGVFVKETNEPVSWMISRTPNGMSSLHTLEEFRQRGYASFVSQYLAKRMAQAGYLPYATIDPSNEASKKCFRNAGFSFTTPVYVFTALRPNSK